MRQQVRFLLCLFIGFSFSTQAQFVNFEDTWKEFLSNSKTSNISKLTKPSREIITDFAKYSLMYATTHFCSDDIDTAKEHMDEIRKIGEAKYSQIPGYKDRFDDLDIKIKAYYKVDVLWDAYLAGRSVGLNDLEIDLATKVCEKGTLAKHAHMTAYAYYCEQNFDKAKEFFENRVLKLVERTTLKASDVAGLEKEVEKTKKLFAALKKLDVAWAAYMKTGESTGFDEELPLVKCNAVPSMKAYLLMAASNLCGSGTAMYEKIKKLKASNKQQLAPELEEKIKWLEMEVGKYTGDLAVLNKAWMEFVPTNTLKAPIKFGFDYCKEEDRVRAYIMNGMVNWCTEGMNMLKKISEVLTDYEYELGKDTEDKLKALVSKHEESEAARDTLFNIWSEFIESGDTITRRFHLADTYCDMNAQIQAWAIKGHLKTCEEGQQYLDRIDALQKTSDEELDDEVACRVLRLRGKVYQCRYWELVLQARKETHAERERFGPESAKIMQGDLNSEQLPCETTVQYTPLKNIGIQYIISTYLCQDIDLAKMGDPEYYKKIANWVDTKVLKAYCEENMRCKEDFYIYLEGHTDGHAFKGVRYKKSLDIPEGTSYTHFTGYEANDKTTDREITNTLRSNVELGIARAWTVKHQLDFMGVPIEIGAYEHPEEEKGGEYRKVDIELNITNLMLDFYEKRLKELIDASGIGERPETC